MTKPGQKKKKVVKENRKSFIPVISRNSVITIELISPHVHGV